jgi:phosphate starvation-inducible PhoH-like protein
VDLPAGQVSGLRIVQDILAGVPDIHFARLTSHDVVRHRLVGEIVDAYERYDARQRDSAELSGPGGTAGADGGRPGGHRGAARGGGKRGH